MPDPAAVRSGDSDSNSRRRRVAAPWNRPTLPFIQESAIPGQTCRMLGRPCAASKSDSPRLRPSAPFAKNCEPRQDMIGAGRAGLPCPRAGRPLRCRSGILDGAKCSHAARGAVPVCDVPPPVERQYKVRVPCHLERPHHSHRSRALPLPQCTNFCTPPPASRTAHVVPRRCEASRCARYPPRPCAPQRRSHPPPPEAESVHSLLPRTA